MDRNGIIRPEVSSRERFRDGFLNQLAMGGHLSMYWVVPERVDSEGDWFIIERLPLV
jgi:hypothetical protein